ncbi:ARM repeat-containing protein [Tothia fuscella]|uniref:ARM repeat-containing protein n=1 Tax=Tothia fuscella TaxID=1048955 RepID=A0A9P4U1H7_9PEZI|nr:ARM repeat-containing protein [Tothia fuscella]
MATNGVATQQTLQPILAAVETMQGNVDRARKEQAVQFLDKFQKTSEAWNVTFSILHTDSVNDQSKMFAATTLKGKIVYDLHQLPRAALLTLRDSVLSLLKQYRAGPKPIRTQLCICLAQLAIQVLEWKDVLPLINSTLGTTEASSISCILEFLKILPEEVTEGRKFNLSEEDLIARTKELLEDNAKQVLQFLSHYGTSSATAAQDPQLMDCIQSWTREIPVAEIINSPLFQVLVAALDAPESFDPAVDCLCTMIRETRDVDENLAAINSLSEKVLALRPRTATASQEEDTELFNGIARIFAEAGDNWVLLIAREPILFRPLVEAILETAALDKEKESVSHTFNFWYELKQYLTLERYQNARLQFMDVYSKLVDVMITHLEYPKPESGNEKDLFEGDREAEEKFREFRHQMGDVLKDCCEVLGSTECLAKPYNLIEAWVRDYGGQAVANNVPNWQALEAPLFALRSMGREIPKDESIMLPRLIPLIVQIPDHQKVRFQAVMVLGRYTEWSAQHPETLQPQLTFIIEQFSHPSKEVKQAAALSFKFFCTDCAELLKGEVAQLQQFYAGVVDSLSSDSQEEITEGVAAILAKQSTDQIYNGLRAFCTPVVQSIVARSQVAVTKEDKVAISDKVQLLTIFIQYVQLPYVESGEHPAVKYCQEIFPILAEVASKFPESVPLLERVCRCWRYMVISYRTAIAPLLPELATNLSNGFNTSRQGCFLWATDSIVREFNDEAEGVDPQFPQAVYSFYEQQATTFLRVLNDLPPDELPDVIEDFFRLSQDILIYHSNRAFHSQLMESIVSAATSCLAILKEEPLMATLHFLRDLLGFGQESSPFSSFDQPNRQVPHDTRQTVHQMVMVQGMQLTQRLLTGMMFTFPQNCYPDASGVLLGLFQLVPQQAAEWLKATLALVPDGSVTVQEQEVLLRKINASIASGEVRGIRTLLQDFTNQYRRRNVAPREGLGRLEATRFRFAG